MPTSPRLAELVAVLAAAGVSDVELLGDGERRIARLAPLHSAQADALSFVAQARYASQLQHSAAGSVIVGPALREAVAQRLADGDGPLAAALVSSDPYRAFAALTRWWAQQLQPQSAAGVHPSAVIEPGACVDPSAHVAALAYVGAGARIGAHAVIGAHCVVAAGAQVGEGTRLAARVTLGEACRIGARGIVHSGVVIGADGFGFAPHAGRWEKIAQLGAVRIGDDVEIGANTCIDRGALEDTLLDDGVKLDNLIQIAHNVHIGAHTAMAGCSAVAGSTRIGRHCTVGGAANILGHLQLADHVHISAATVVSRSILKPGQYSGFFPFDDNAAWEKNAATLRHLHALRERVRALEKALPPPAGASPAAAADPAALPSHPDSPEP